MSRILRNHADAILGTVLGPVELGDDGGSASDAIGRAVRCWAPTARVQAMRFASPGPPRDRCSTFNARVYALHMDKSNVVVLQVWTGDAMSSGVSAMVDLRLPAAAS